MCGIVGIFSLTGKPMPERSAIRRMADSIAHRGPDDEGFYLDDRVALGFRRLSIIDLNTGNQPIHNEDKQIWTVLNGEIYNYKELRRSLEEKNHSFYTNTDTEVLVHLYEEYGEGMVQHLRGMFSFCIWDRRKNKLSVFRDRLGIKPLFYAQTNGYLLFASEMKALLASGLVPKEIDPLALNHYLGLQYVPAPATIYRGIRKLKPAHKLCISPGDTLVKQIEYWDLSDIPVSPMSFDDCKARYSELLVESVKLHLMSDVPLGAFLSGGVDSSAVVALMAELSPNPVNTFTICHKDKAYDESAYAKAVSDRYGTRHHTLTIGPADLLNLLPSVLEQYDEPFADSSALPTHMVSMLARKHVAVALSGDGGDETCAGYSRYAYEMQFAKMENSFNLRRVVPGFIKSSLYNNLPPNHSFSGKAVKYLANLLATDAERHLFFMSYFRKAKIRLYGASSFSSQTPDDDILLFNTYLDKFGGDDTLRKILYLDQKTYLPDDILYKVDIASMANSLEVRVPLLDHKLVEFLAGVPTRFKVVGNVGKAIFKTLFEDKLPHDVLYRKKRGFEIPISSWFRNELAGYVKDTLLPSSLLVEPYFDSKYIEKMLSAHQSGKQDFGPQLWILLSLAVWHNKNNATLSI